MKSAFAPAVLIALIASALGVLFAAPLSHALFGVAEPRYGLLAITCALAALCARLLSLVLRMRERALAFSLSQVVPKLLFLAVVGLAIVVNEAHNLVHLELALLASWLGAVIVTAWYTRDDWRPALRSPFDKQLSMSLIRYSLPLVVSGLGYWALTATSSFSLRYLSTLHQLGVYSVALSFAGAAVVVQSIFSVVWAPIVYRWAATETDMRKVDRVSEQALALVAVMFVAVGSLSFLVDLLLPRQYSQVKYLVLASIAAPLLYTLSEVTSIGINLTRRTSWSIWATLIAFAVSLGLNLLLAPPMGAPGAVIANMFGYVAFLVARTEASRRLWRPFHRTRMYVIVTLACALATLTVVWGPSTGLWYALVWASLAPVVVWGFRHEWRPLIGRLRGLTP